MYLYTGWIIKRPKFSAIKKITCSKPRQNCLGNRTEHCLHYTYSSHQWRHATCHWAILDKEGTLLKSTYQKVTLHQSGYTILGPVSRKKLRVSIRVSWNRKTDAFFINLQKTKAYQNRYIDLLKTFLLPECHRHYPGRLHSCCWMGIGHHILQILILWITAFGISCRIWCTKANDFRLKIYRPERVNQKQVEGGHHWDSLEMNCVMDKTTECDWKAEWRHIFR